MRAGFRVRVRVRAEARANAARDLGTSEGDSGKGFSLASVIAHQSLAA